MFHGLQEVLPLFHSLAIGRVVVMGLQIAILARQLGEFEERFGDR